VLDWSRAQVSIMRPDPHARAMEAIVRDLISTRDGATYFAERVWNTSMRYDLGDGHALVGRSVPDFEFINGTRLTALLGNGRGLLVDFDSYATLRELASHWGNHVKYVDGAAKDRLGLTAVLVRPDGVVAWACDGKPDSAEARMAGSRWFKVTENGSHNVSQIPSISGPKGQGD
jgi:hypothetical protein